MSYNIQIVLFDSILLEYIEGKKQFARENSNHRISDSINFGTRRNKKHSRNVVHGEGFVKNKISSDIVRINQPG